MGKFYTILASFMAVLEVVDFFNLSISKQHMVDPVNTVATYHDLSEDVQNTVHMMATWVGLAKLYMACFLVGTALSSEPKVRAVAGGLACVTTYVSLFTLVPAMQPVLDSGFAKVEMDLKMVMAFVIGPLYGISSYLEVKEMPKPEIKKA